MTKEEIQAFEIERERIKNAALRRTSELSCSIADLEIMTKNRDALHFCLERLVNELPTSRDWLDPDLEKQCKTVLMICN